MPHIHEGLRHIFLINDAVANLQLNAIKCLQTRLVRIEKEKY